MPDNYGDDKWCYLCQACSGCTVYPCDCDINKALDKINDWIEEINNRVWNNDNTLLITEAEIDYLMNVMEVKN